VILIVLVVAGAVVWAVLAKTNGDKDHLAGAAYEDPLEAEAQRFLGRAMGIADDGRLDEAARLLADAGGKYDATVAGPKIARLAETLAARIEAKKREDGDRKRREEEAKLAGLLADAERSEKAGDLDAAVEFLRRAQAMQDDAAVRERIARLERALAARRLLHEGIAHEGGGRLAEAAGAYEKAMPDALGADGDEAERRLAAVRKRIAVEQAVASVQGKIDARQWRAAWDAAGAAKANGVADPRIEELARRAANELAPKKALTGPLGIELVLVPGGTFRMGSDSGGDHEKPVHEVTVSSFYLGRHEVTQAQYEGVMGANPSRAKGASLPVEQVSWFDATEFCRRLSAKSGAQFRLPTEAEWEYAARGGQGRTYPWGEDPPGPRRANLKGRADGHEGAAPVGSFPDGATPEGVTDLAGNVAEWCGDWIGPYAAGAARDPSGPPTGSVRAVRGGSFVHETTWARGSARAGRKADEPVYLVGFRVVRELTDQERMFLPAPPSDAAGGREAGRP